MERSLKEINYCALGDECLFDEKGYMAALFGPNVLGVAFRRERSVNNVVQKSTGHKYLFYDIMTNWSLRHQTLDIRHQNFLLVTTLACVAI